MKKIILLLIVALLATNSINAETTLWKVEKDGNVLFLGGSIHVLRPTDYPMPKEFDEAFSKASVLVLETDIDQLENPLVAQKIMQKAMYKDERTLKTVLSDKVYAKLEKECAKVGLPLAQLNKMKPSMVVVTIAVMNMKKMGVTGEGVDKNYLIKAKSDKLKLGYLESVDFQMDLITGLGDGNENEFVEYSLEDMKEMESGLVELINAWKVGDKKVMDKKITEMKTEFPGVYNDMLVKRNNSWIPKIMDYLKNKEKEIVIVGALHMYGEDGILNLLKKQGCKIEKY
jgi:uncharacterized protein YbaP (TraB family)